MVPPPEALAERQRSPAFPESALQTHFDQQIRPMLDVVDKLRSLGVTQEGIQLPTIVVVGDQSHGKSSVLESLAEITLPRRQGIATRVPLILRLQSCKVASEQSITIEYLNVKDEIKSEELIEAAIDEATNVLAGPRKDVRDTPISLHVRKLGAPDLTMVDLPGITRVPVHGQPDNIYEQIAAMIQKYINPPESIILNVISATVDFPTCESIRMSQLADKEGKRTLAVVTKVDKAPEGLYEKVTSDAVNIGLGYICVRNRSRLSMVGIPMLAYRLTCIQAQMIQGCLPGLYQQIFDALHKRRRELDSLPTGFQDNAEARVLFFKIHNEQFKAIDELVREGKLDKFLEDNHMHYTARLHEMFQNFGDDLRKTGKMFLDQTSLEDIVELLSEHKGLVKNEINKISAICYKLVKDSYAYASEVVMAVNRLFFEGYKHMSAFFRGQAIDSLRKSEKESTDFVARMLKKEREIIFTTNDYYLDTLDKIRFSLENAKRSSNYNTTVEIDKEKTLRLNELHGKSQDYHEAWRMKASVAAYWKVLQKRLADEIPLEIRFALQTTVTNVINEQIARKVWSGNVELKDLMQQDPAIVQKRARLEHSIDTLESSLSLLSSLLVA
ncbi:hypothetical protein O6H91_01G108500 [Diphasiastrum complanatum]|uniref:Uncharacterized protein n=1 Tax=Diphasiastrum complanatum TaxID=34168 RepID=A0ACC2EUT7_DIPCM|nr:hypothetical protein O6H91_01G108500 [Diphasiastrum complanatum]